MTPVSSLITITEEGEAIGTLRQFGRSFTLSLTGRRHALDTTARDCVILRAGSAPDRLLVLDGCGLPTLFAASATAQERGGGVTRPQPGRRPRRSRPAATHSPRP